MEFQDTALKGVVILKLKTYRDSRGYFRELFRFETAAARLGVPDFCQDNMSVSHKSVIRALHLQKPPAAQGKLVFCLRGAIWDVAVDVRKGSATYGKWVGFELSEENGQALFIPEGCAHGFQALQDDSSVIYKCTRYYDASTEVGFRFDDPDVGVQWPLKPWIVNPRDQGLPLLSECGL